jgi:hypothetical protein
VHLSRVNSGGSATYSSQALIVAKEATSYSNQAFIVAIDGSTYSNQTFSDAIQGSTYSNQIFIMAIEGSTYSNQPASMAIEGSTYCHAFDGWQYSLLQHPFSLLVRLLPRFGYVATGISVNVRCLQ